MKKVVWMIVWCSVLAGATAWAEIRVWTDRAGRKVQAEWVATEGDMVTIKRMGGSLIKLRFAQLSDVDQAYASSQAGGGAAVPGEALDLPATPGKTSGEIKCAKNEKFSWFLYLPKSFHPGKKWPVMFIMSPGGGKANTANRYIPGAEKNGWILAVSKQSKNGYNEAYEAVEAMSEDVLARLPIDENRIYATGFSGGARMAFGMATRAKKTPYAGILACGAGATSFRDGKGMTVYGLGGTNGFNRWDMACTFENFKNPHAVLRYFPGKHVWAPEALITDAMTWLNGAFLRARTREPQYRQEIQDYGTRTMQEIQAAIESRPEWAWEWTNFMQDYPLDPQSKGAIGGLKSKFVVHAGLRKYTAAKKDLDKYVDRYLATSVMDYANNNPNEKAMAEAAKLKEKHAGTALEEIFSLIGEKAPFK